MKIAFDQQVFLLQEYGGISRYLCNIAKFLAQTPSIDIRVIAPLHFNQNLNELQDVLGKGILLPKLNSKVTRLVMEASKHLARLSISNFSPDILHETYYSADDYRPRNAKRVLTIHDMIHERYSDLFERSHMTIEPKRIAALRADHVICVSENTRRDLMEFSGLSEDRISVIYLGVDHEFWQNAQTLSIKRTAQRPYLLYVGSRDGYKNFGQFLVAFAHSKTLKDNFDIVCFGGGSLRSHELKMLSDLGLHNDQVTHLSGSDYVLAALYRDAEAFVYPSLYEGFGIPPLEAMAANCPVISSNTSSLPEVVGEAAEYFDPNDVESMTATLERVLNSPSRRQELIALGKKQCQKFSWEKCAHQTISVYQELI